MTTTNNIRYLEEKSIEAILESAINDIIESGVVWYPSNMAFACRSALINSGYKITIPPTVHLSREE